MSIFPVRHSDFSSFTIITNPKRSFSSSSTGATGSVYISSRRTEIEKDINIPSSFIDATYDDIDVNNILNAAKTSALIESSSYSKISQYLDAVNAKQRSVTSRAALEIERFTPSYTFTKNTVRKLVIKDNIVPYYKHYYPTSQWAYTNYNSLNFFTADTVPTSSVLLYPNVEGATPHVGYHDGVYSLSGAFTFDFYINARYKNDSEGSAFNAGTIFHLSSSYALSLVSGTLKDENGLVSGYKLRLQLSHSADVKPSIASPGTYPNNLIFESDDNSILWNKWHHVIVRWGTSQINNGTGSFVVDGIERGTFVIPSSTISPKLSNITATPDVLCVGNFYEGNNTGNSSQAYFFATNVAQRDGLEMLIDDGGVQNEPNSYRFAHQLNAELHDVAIKRRYSYEHDIFASSSKGIERLDSDVAFYLPLFFTAKSPVRTFVDYGGIPQTPFFEADGTTYTPFNVAMSFGVAGHYINIENHLRDFANSLYPRCHQMTASILEHTTSPISANEYIYRDKFAVRRNLLILPCDDGNFTPNYGLLSNEEDLWLSHDDDDQLDLSLVSLSNLVSTSSLLFGSIFDVGAEFSVINGTSSYVQELVGPSPEFPGKQPGTAYNVYMQKVVENNELDAPLTIYQRTLDNSSNQVTFFNVSNLYYGKNIQPKTVVIRDAAFTGSNGKFGITLRDDGLGNIYRADSLTKHATWSSVGNVFYNEGIIVIKNPMLNFFGKDQFEIDLNGEQNIHVLKIETIAPMNLLNSSSNPNYLPLSASLSLSDQNSGFVYIAGINYHDSDMNVVAKTQFAQPITKRFDEKILFRSKVDF